MHILKVDKKWKNRNDGSNAPVKLALGTITSFRISPRHFLLSFPEESKVVQGAD